MPVPNSQHMDLNSVKKNIKLNKKGKTLPAITFEVIRKQTQHENQAQPKKKISTPRNKIQQFYKKVVYIDPT